MLLQRIDNGSFSFDESSVKTMINSTTDATCQYFAPYVEKYYPTYSYHWCNHSDRIETAFKIINSLMEKKLIKLYSIKQFIEVVNEVSKLV